MKFPHSELVLVEKEEIVGYLLNSSHPFGRSKARFFGRFGFSINAWEELAEALRRHGRQNRVTGFDETEFGVRYQVDGPLIAPDGRRPTIRSVWQVEKEGLAPRLITAYPLGDL